MKKISGIYSIIHIESGRPYVGSAININKRWSEHRFDLTSNKHDNPRLQNFWNKYGPKAFEFKILEEVTDPSQLLVRDQYWMDILQSHDYEKGFNIRLKAESNLGLKQRPETVEKIRQGNIGKHRDQEGENNSFFGKTHSPESLEKMRTPRSDEVKQSMSEGAQKRWEGHTISKPCPNCQLVVCF